MGPSTDAGYEATQTQTQTQTRFADLGIRAEDATTRAVLAALERAFDISPATRAAALRAASLRQEARDEAEVLRPSVSLVGGTIEGSVSLVAKQPLVDFGARAARVGEIRARAQSATTQLAEDRATLLQGALLAVLEGDHARAQAKIHRAQIAEFTQARDTAQRLADLNLVTQADVRFAEVNLQTSQAQLARAQSAARDAARAWAQVMPPAADLAGSARSDSLPLNLPEGLSPQALLRAAGLTNASTLKVQTLSRNLPLRRLEARLAELDAETTSARRANRPVVNAVAQSTHVNGRTSTSIGLGVDVLLYDRSANSRLRAKERDRAALLAETAALMQELDFALQDLSAREADALALVALQEDSLTLLRGRVADLESQLESGLGRYSDVIEAQAKVYDTALEISENRHAADVARVRMLLLSGVLVP